MRINSMLIFYSKFSVILRTIKRNLKVQLVLTAETVLSEGNPCAGAADRYTGVNLKINLFISFFKPYLVTVE